VAEVAAAKPRPTINLLPLILLRTAYIDRSPAPLARPDVSTPPTTTLNPAPHPPQPGRGSVFFIKSHQPATLALCYLPCFCAATWGQLLRLISLVALLQSGYSFTTGFLGGSIYSSVSVRKEGREKPPGRASKFSPESLSSSARVRIGG